MTIASAKNVFVKSYGCQMNVYDAERMGDILEREGYLATENIEEADLIVLNTCHIREKAAEKVYSELGRIREMKRDRKKRGFDTRIVVAGCVAQAEGAEIIRRAPAVDLVVGPQNYQNLPALLQQSLKKPVVETEFPAEDKFGVLPAPTPKTIRARGVSSFVTVQEGCDKFCTFCVVPYTRGSEYSRTVQEIMAEIERLTASGVREITLLGQNVNAYHGLDESGQTVALAQLLDRVATIPGIARVRYTTSHPLDMDETLARAHRDNPALMPYLHLPVQSGSDRILDLMNRRHTVDQFRSALARVKHYRPDIAFSSDFIVGFPGETDADFAATMQLVEEVGFSSAYTFKYSPRPGTPAADMPDQVPESVKDARLQSLQALVTKQQRAFQESMVGQTLDILVERPGRKPGQVSGKSPHLLAVAFEGSTDLIGQIVSVDIVESVTNSLVGQVSNRERAVA